MNTTGTNTMPADLVPPCEPTREARIHWMQNLCSHRGGSDYEARPFGKYSRGGWLFCWNVKVHDVDFSFENLRNRVIEMGYGDAVEDSPEARPLYEAELAGCVEILFDWAIDDARRDYVSDRRGEDGPGNHAFASLWDGTQVDTRFAFLGRRGGWLVFTGFNGLTLTTDLEWDELSDEQVGQLAEMVRFVDRSVEGDKPRLRVEEQAAFNFFCNVAEDVPERAATERVQFEAEVWP